MLLNAYSLLDTKTGIFHAPFFFSHVQQAIRAVVGLASDLDTTVGRHPADYALVEVGSYDDQTGRLEGTTPVNLGTAVYFLEAERASQPRFNLDPTTAAEAVAREHGRPMRTNGGAA